MKSGKIRIIAIFLSCLMLFALVSGCSKDGEKEKDSMQKEAENEVQDKNEERKKEEAKKPVPGELPIVDDGTTLTLCFAENPLVTDYYDNYFTNWLEEQTGIKLEFELLPTDEPTRKLELLIASESELPDILLMNLSVVARDSYGADGVIIALDDYIDEYFHHLRIEAAKANDYYPFGELAEHLIKVSRSPDGNLYAFPSINHDPTSDCARQWYINQTWLDYLGLEMPETTDDFYNVLKAFKDQDPNQNGKADEIPLMGATGWYQKPELHVLSAFVYIPYGSGDPVHHFFVENGKVDTYANKEAYREGLRYVHKLCKEDLLSPVSFTQNSEQLKAMVSLPENEDTIVGVFTGSRTHVFDPDQATKILEYETLPPLGGPEGVRWSSNLLLPSIRETYITRDCQTPEVAVCFLDFLKTQESSMIQRYGPEGKHWEYHTGSEPSRYDYLGYDEVLFKTNPGVPQPLGQPGNDNWQTQDGLFMPGRLYAAFARVKREDPDPIAEHSGRIFADGVAARKAACPDELLGIPQYSQAELDKLGDISTTVNSYINECRVRFITGELDIEKDWDKYVDDLEKMGLERYIEVAQEYYDRMN